MPRIKPDRPIWPSPPERERDAEQDRIPGTASDPSSEAASAPGTGRTAQVSETAREAGFGSFAG